MGVREAKDLTQACERNLSVNVKKAADTWAEASAGVVAGTLQKELSKISDGVAAALAQQLSQSRRFCEALAKGVQMSGGTATKQALQALRPPKQLQDTVSSAMTEALQDSLAPVFRTELRAHFEKELVPLIAQRVNEMMTSFRDRMIECLDGIATKQEQAAKRLGQHVAPLVAEELKQVEKILAQKTAAGEGAAGGASAISQTQLDELASAVNTEVIAPLHTRIKDLTAQVQTLREEARQLERRWSACKMNGADDRTGPSSATFPVPVAVASPAEVEEGQVREVQQLFASGRTSQAFMRGMAFQQAAVHTDFLNVLCDLVPTSPGEWLSVEEEGASSPLSMEAKMLFMLSLARQLSTGGLSDDDMVRKMEWVNELWFAFDLQDSNVATNASRLCTQLLEALEGAECKGTSATQLRRLRQGIKVAARLLD